MVAPRTPDGWPCNATACGSTQRRPLPLVVRKTYPQVIPFGWTTRGRPWSGQPTPCGQGSADHYPLWSGQRRPLPLVVRAAPTTACGSTQRRPLPLVVRQRRPLPLVVRAAPTTACGSTQRRPLPLVVRAAPTTTRAAPTTTPCGQGSADHSLWLNAAPTTTPCGQAAPTTNPCGQGGWPADGQTHWPSRPCWWWCGRCGHSRQPGGCG